MGFVWGAMELFTRIAPMGPIPSVFFFDDDSVPVLGAGGKGTPFIPLANTAPTSVDNAQTGAVGNFPKQRR